MSEQIEQDLIISPALVELYNDPHVKNALVFRGGTALNKLFLKNPELKKNHRDFHMNMSVLLPSKLHWNFDEAYQFLVANVISRLP